MYQAIIILSILFKPINNVLLFPRATVLQFTYGISVPAILPSRSINLSLGLQVNYDLPNNLTQLLQPRIVMARNYDLSREKFYKHIIEFLNNFNINGEECLLRLICEVAEIGFNFEQKENLLERLAHFMFTPSLDAVFNQCLLKAEHTGIEYGNCGIMYKCPISIVDLFTSKYTNY